MWSAHCLLDELHWAKVAVSTVPVVRASADSLGYNLWVYFNATSITVHLVPSLLSCNLEFVDCALVMDITLKLETDNACGALGSSL